MGIELLLPQTSFLGTQHHFYFLFYTFVNFHNIFLDFLTALFFVGLIVKVEDSAYKLGNELLSAAPANADTMSLPTIMS